MLVWAQLTGARVGVQHPLRLVPAGKHACVFTPPPKGHDRSKAWAGGLTVQC